MPLKISKNKLQYSRDEIINFIRSYFNDSGLEGALVALSGGIDSALVATLGYEALGDKLSALILPEEGSNLERDLVDAQQLAESLGIRYEIVPINSALDSIKNCYPRIEKPSEKQKIAWGNVKARVRMIINYISSNLDDKLLLGTGNKTEILLGYFTKHGDGGVDILPIGDLYKTQVKQLAQFIELDEGIVNKPPSAGLWGGQTDEDDLGASYVTLDTILYNFIHEKKTIAEISNKFNINEEFVKDISSRIEKNKHKSISPPIVKLFD
jgi:NAD+ synthase|tara:strand:- start:4544 stop:5347 length:804 start_codon:yes stop_codon:yes gene_type:complete